MRGFRNHNTFIFLEFQFNFINQLLTTVFICISLTIQYYIQIKKYVENQMVKQHFFNLLYEHCTKIYTLDLQFFGLFLEEIIIPLLINLLEFLLFLFVEASIIIIIDNFMN